MLFATILLVLYIIGHNNLVTPLPEVETSFTCCDLEQNLAGVPFRSKEHNYIISYHLLPVRLRPSLHLNISVFLMVYQSESLSLVFVICDIVYCFCNFVFVIVICTYLYLLL